MKRVAVYELVNGSDSLLGHLVQDQGTVQPIPDVPLLRRMATRPVRDWSHDEPGIVQPADPEFLDRLADVYASAYLRVSAPLSDELKTLDDVTIKYSDDQPRTPDGRWGSGEGATKPSKNGSQWASRLSSNEVDAIERYTDGEYSRMRDCDSGKGCSEATKEKLRALYSAAAKAPPGPKTIFRGMQRLSESQIKNYSRGATITMEAVTSFSAAKSVALNFASSSQGNNILLQVQGNRVGRLVQHLSEESHEKEVLVPRGVQYSVVRVEKAVKTDYDKSIRHIVTLKQIPFKGVVKVKTLDGYDIVVRAASSDRGNRYGDTDYITVSGGDGSAPDDVDQLDDVVLPEETEPVDDRDVDPWE